MQNDKADEQPDEAAANWKFKPEEQDVSAQSPKTEVKELHAISWTASEFVLHDKSAVWYMLIVLSGIALATFTYFVTANRDIVAPIIMVVATIIFAVYASRKPRELKYELDASGLTIDQKLYSYPQFRSFSILREDGIESVWFLPLKRFSPGLTVYFAPDDRDKIIDVLSQYLPVEPRQLDILDKLLHKIRF